MEEERTTEIRREPPPPPWYEEHWWVFLVALLLIVGGIVAFFALRGGDDAEPAATATVPTQTETVTTAETETVTTAETEAPPASPAGFELPDLTGLDHHDAAEELVDAGLLPETYPVESAEERATVVGQEPSPGATVRPAAVVRLDVALGTGEREQLEVPDLAGLGVAEALEECARAGFTCRLAAGEARERPVTSQRPAAGTAAPELTQIRLSQA